jgi:hypothetical protein
MKMYVSPQGNDKNSGASLGQALRTPQLAADRANPGDTILLAEGEYIATEQQGAVLFITRSGSLGKPITFTAVSGHRPILRSKGAWEVMKISGASHIVIEKLFMRGIADEVTLEEAKKESNNLLNPRTCGNGLGITDDKDKKTFPTHITVRNCDIRDFSGGGLFSMHGDYITFENNFVARCGFWAPYACSNISVYQCVNSDNNSGYKIIIRNNVSFGSYNNIPFYYSDKDHPEKRHVSDGNGIIIDDLRNTQEFGGANGIKAYTGKTLIANNVVFDNGGSGIHAYSSNNIDIVHNYAGNNNTHPDISGGQIFANATSNVRVLNNILIAPAGKAVNSNYDNDASVLYDYNIYASIDGSTPKFTRDLAHNMLQSPQLTLTDWAKGKRLFKAATKSPLRRAGMDFPEIRTDFFGKPRPKIRPDIGPFQL